MLRRLLSLLAAVLCVATVAHAQESGNGAGRMEVGVFPGGGILFTESSNNAEPTFSNYALGASFTLNLNRYFGVEGEGGGSLGVRQALTFNGVELTEQRTPNTWMYMGNLVYNPIGNDRTFVPYATGGAGGVTMCNCKTDNVANLGLTSTESFLTGNAGGGVKWFAARHVGLRADYRLFVVKNKATAPAFFGQENRLGHRVYGGMLLTY